MMLNADSLLFPLVAVDVGNSRVKLGLFDAPPEQAFPVPSRSITLGSDLNWQNLAAWLDEGSSPRSWLIASVQRATAARLFELLAAHASCTARLLTAGDLPLHVDVPEPERVGIDRLVNAVAANHLRAAGRGAIVIDLGSAITIDAVSADGVFLGGAILPGIGMSARALHEFTDLLPLSEMTELRDAPEALGKNTTAALRSGLFWGAVGSMRELILRLSAQVPQPQVLLTGGAAPSVARFLADGIDEPPQFVPHLTLSGIALSAGSHSD